jgi:hypothetical protein
MQNKIQHEKKFRAMLIPKDISERIIVKECGASYADEMAATVFSDTVEKHLVHIVRSFLPQSSSSSSPQTDEVSEEFLLRELEMQDTRSINVTTSDALAAIEHSLV